MRASLIAVAVALALPAAARADEAQVDMFSTAFNPAKLTVVAGDTVTWRNGDIVVHDVKGAGVHLGRDRALRELLAALRHPRHG